MKLVSTEINNFRVHSGDEPLKVCFDERLHVIHGPNEAGKSTVMEAVAACLFQKSTLTGNAHKAMQPDDGSKPEIQVVFERGGKEYKVRKQFKGQSGTCELTVSQDGRVESTANGSDAEEQLNEALNLPSAGRGDRKEDQMAHWRLLWVNQGASKQEPTGQINDETRDDLQGILTAETDGTVLSPEEAAWIAELEKAVNACFTSTGKTKTGSRTAVLAEEVEELVSELRGAKERVSSVESDSDRYVANGLKLKEIEEKLPGFREQMESQREQEKASETLAQQVKEIQASFQLEQRDLDAVRARLEELNRLAKAIETRNAKLLTVVQAIAALDNQLDEDRQLRETRIKERDTADDAFTVARRMTLRTQAHAALLRSRADLATRQADLDKAQAIARETKDLEKQIASSPVEESDVEQLREKDAELGRVQAALEAASAKVTIDSSELTKLVQGDDAEALQPGETHERLLDQETRIAVGDETASITVIPGGEDLGERRDRVADAERDIRNRLTELGIESVDAAKEKLRDRQSLEGKLQLAESRLADVAGDGVEALEDLRDTANKTMESSEAELGRHSQHNDQELPEELEAAEQEVRTRAAAESDSESHRDLARGKLQDLDARIASTKADHGVRVEEQKGLESQIKDDQRLLDALASEHGDAEKATEQIEAMEAQLADLTTKRDDLKRGLDKLQPDLIEAEIARLGRALSSSEDEKRTVENEQNGRLGGLTANDAVGLNEHSGDLKGRVESARDELAREERQAEAMRLLFETAQSCREQMTRQIMEPLRSKVEPLLRVVFGGAQLDFQVNDTCGSLSLKPLVRSGVQDTFDRLSVGTQEQVGIAVRLALALVLAEEHGGRMPVVLDEPFVNTDPQRLERALAMLNYVREDLQVILLTCDFGDYRALGLGQEQVTELVKEIQRD